MWCDSRRVSQGLGKPIDRSQLRNFSDAKFLPDDLKPLAKKDSRKNQVEDWCRRTGVSGWFF
jgi:hypothetical protein